MDNNFDTNFYNDLSDYIDNVDYSSYTLQYPPPFILENKFNNKDFLDWFKFTQKKVWIYIHIPFCDTKCTFCRYYSIIDFKLDTYFKYVNYLIKELEIYKKVLDTNNILIDTIYIWWGTPSILDEVSLEKLLNYIFLNINLDDSYQFCFEANPNSLSIKKIKILKKYNCNRLTLWIQSLDSNVLEKINRVQSKKDVIRSIYYWKKIWIEYINVDLMLWIKWQTYKSFINDVKIVSWLKPDMIHLHPYTSTWRVIDNKNFTSIRDVKMKMEKNWTLYLKSKWYWDIEWDALWFNNNSKNKQLFNALNWWEYIWIGVSSVWYNSLFRTINTDSLNNYYSFLDKWALPVKFWSLLTKEDNMIQYIIYNIRYNEISIGKFNSIFWVDILKYFKEVFLLLKEKWILDIINNKIIFYFKTPYEYSVFSKYFYSKEILLKSKKLIYENK